MTNKEQADRIVAEALGELEKDHSEETVEGFLNYIPDHYDDVALVDMGVEGLISEFDCLYLGEYINDKEFLLEYLRERLEGSEVSVDFLWRFMDWKAMGKYIMKDVWGYGGGTAPRVYFKD